MQLTICVAGLVLWASGLLWLLLENFFVREGAFGPEKSPVEPWALRVHGIFGALTLFLFGLLWGTHVQTAWRFGRKRYSGGTLTGVLILLAVTGYLLYYVADDRLRSFTSIAHWSIGVILPVLFVNHRFKFLNRWWARQRKS